MRWGHRPPCLEHSNLFCTQVASQTAHTVAPPQQGQQQGLTVVPLLLIGQPCQALQQRPQVGCTHVSVAVGVVHFKNAGQEGVASQFGDHLEVGASQLLLTPPQPLEPAGNREWEQRAWRQATDRFAPERT